MRRGDHLVHSGDQTHGHSPKRPGLRKLAADQVQGAREVIVWALQADCPVSEACRMAHVGRATFYEWLQRDPSFAASVEAARGPVIPKNLSMYAHDRMTTRDLISMLRRLKPARYGR